MTKDELVLNLNLIETINSRNPRKFQIMSFIPEAPYDDYKHGIVTVQITKNKNSRRYVILSNPIINKPRFKHIHTLARYAYQVHLWKTKNYLIPNNLHVDHINDDAMDDRLDNYQLLTPEQNTLKVTRLRGALMAVLICPVCLTHFEKRASTTQWAEHRKDQKLISYCSTRCHLASEMTMKKRDAYKDLRAWISDNQIYKLIRVWTDGSTKLESIVSDKMLDFDLTKATGIPIDYGSAKFAPPNERKVMIRDYRNQGLKFEEIAQKMHLSSQEVWKIANEPLQKVHLKGEELQETLARIKHWRELGYSQERIGRLLGMPSGSVGTHIKRHGKAWNIPQDIVAAKGESIVTMVCPICHSEFERPLELTQLLGSRKGRVLCCSGDCRWDFRTKLNKVSDRESVRNWISTNQIIRVDKVIPSGIRFFDRNISHDPKIRTFDMLSSID